MSRNPLEDLGALGGYLREQRESAKLSVRQLSDLAGISNPYLSQIERGLKRPSAEILQQLAKGLQVSAETLYVKAGFLEEKVPTAADANVDVRAAIAADAQLTARQKATLVEIYDSFVGAAAEPAATKKSPARPTTKKPTTKE
jgi:transcriptional regulator with XRE-family HTH domain